MIWRSLIYIFSHTSSLGNAPAHALFEGMQIEQVAPASIARQFSDYSVCYSKRLPEGVELTIL